MISMNPTVLVRLEDESVRLTIACTNLGDRAVRIPWGIGSPDPFGLRITNSLGSALEPFLEGHSYSFGPVPQDSQVLLPGKAALLKGDLMETYLDIPQGNYTLDVSLDMGPHLASLRKCHPEVEHGGDFEARQEAPATFFVPKDFRSKWLEGVVAGWEKQKAKKGFSIWKPSTWHQR